MYCNFELGGKSFQNRKARIHLSGNPKLRNAIISKVCMSAPEDVKKRFTALVENKRMAKENEIKKRKRVKELLKSKLSPATKQSKLCLGTKQSLPHAVVDEAWALAFFGLDIPVNKINNPLFREAIAATSQSKIG